MLVNVYNMYIRNILCSNLNVNKKLFIILTEKEKDHLFLRLKFRRNRFNITDTISNVNYGAYNYSLEW